MCYRCGKWIRGVPNQIWLDNGDRWLCDECIEKVFPITKKGTLAKKAGDIDTLLADLVENGIKHRIARIEMEPQSVTSPETDEACEGEGYDL